MKNLNNMGNVFGSIVGNLVNNVRTTASAVWNDVRQGYEAVTTTHFSSSEEVWMQVTVQQAELKGSVIFIHAKDVKTSKTVVMTISTAGQYKDSQLKKLGALLCFMGQCPVETAQQACTTINQAPEKRLLVLLKGWTTDPTLANVIRVQKHDHVAKAEPKAEPVTEPKAEPKVKAKGKGKAKQLDESC